MKTRTWITGLLVSACVLSVAYGGQEDAKVRLLDAENRALRSQIATLKKQVTALEKQVADTKAELAKVRRENEELRKRLSKEKTAPAATGYVANSSSGIVHRADCSSVARMKPANRVKFSRLADALAEGYRRCKNCMPRATTAPATRAEGPTAAGAAAGKHKEDASNKRKSPVSAVKKE